MTEEADREGGGAEEEVGGVKVGGVKVSGAKVGGVKVGGYSVRPQTQQKTERVIVQS